MLLDSLISCHPMQLHQFLKVIFTSIVDLCLNF
jgi:hypothetical protein